MSVDEFVDYLGEHETTAELAAMLWIILSSKAERSRRAGRSSRC